MALPADRSTPTNERHQRPVVIAMCRCEEKLQEQIVFTGFQDVGCTLKAQLFTFAAYTKCPSAEAMPCATLAEYKGSALPRSPQEYSFRRMLCSIRMQPTCANDGHQGGRGPVRRTSMHTQHWLRHISSQSQVILHDFLKGRRDTRIRLCLLDRKGAVLPGRQPSLQGSSKRSVQHWVRAQYGACGDDIL
jgi:hypothetical protein